jgi:hypothetical protein
MFLIHHSPHELPVSTLKNCDAADPLVMEPDLAVGAHGSTGGIGAEAAGRVIRNQLHVGAQLLGEQCAGSTPVKIGAAPAGLARR